MVNKAKSLYLEKITINDEKPPEYFGNPLKMGNESTPRKNLFMAFLEQEEDVDQHWIKYEREMTLLKPKLREEKKSKRSHTTNHTYVELTQRTRNKSSKKR